MLYDQQISEKKSIWEAIDQMPTVSEITPTSAQASQIFPQYSPDNRQLQPYKQAWILESPPANDNVSTKKSRCEPDKKCIFTMLGMGILIGLFLCGIPLAVMTTMYLQQKSQTSSNNAATNAASTTISTSISLPYQCSSYLSLTDSFRPVTYTSTYCACDSISISTSWYRVSGAAGTQLATTPVTTGSCGTSYPAWYNGSLPTTPGATTSGVACVNLNGNLCYLGYSSSIVLATNCNGFYVFYLTPLSCCCGCPFNPRYCTV